MNFGCKWLKHRENRFEIDGDATVTARNLRLELEQAAVQTFRELLPEKVEKIRGEHFLIKFKKFLHKRDRPQKQLLVCGLLPELEHQGLELADADLHRLFSGLEQEILQRLDFQRKH